MEGAQALDRGSLFPNCVPEQLQTHSDLKELSFGLSGPCLEASSSASVIGSAQQVEVPLRTTPSLCPQNISEAQPPLCRLPLPQAPLHHSPFPSPILIKSPPRSWHSLLVSAPIPPSLQPSAAWEALGRLKALPAPPCFPLGPATP